MIAWGPLAAADLEPYLKLIGLIVALSIMAINRLLTGLKKSRAELPPPREALAPQDPVAAAATRPDLNAEIKEFLRRAAQQRSGGERGPQAPPRQATPVAPLSDSRNEGRNEGPRKQKRKSRQPKSVGAEVPKPDDSLANRRMTSRLESTALDDRAEQLSSLDKLNEIDAHVQQSLDHHVGQLTSGLADSTTAAPTADGSAGSDDSPANSAASIAALVRNPQSIRTAMILNEILTRPADRW